MITDHPHLAALMQFGLHRDMGVKFHMAHEGRAHISFVVTPAMLTMAPALHAGYLYTACDLASYAALTSLLRPDEGAVTHDLHVSVMRSAMGGETVDIHAQVVKHGRTLAFLDARAMTGERLLATARITKSLTQA
jgi:uncharacterized protein (TIGR00369 family)